MRKGNPSFTEPGWGLLGRQEYGIPLNEQSIIAGRHAATQDAYRVLEAAGDTKPNWGRRTIHELEVMGDAVDQGDRQAALAIAGDVQLDGMRPSDRWRKYGAQLPPGVALPGIPYQSMRAVDLAIKEVGEEVAREDYLIAYWTEVLMLINEPRLAGGGGESPLSKFHEWFGRPQEKENPAEEFRKRPGGAFGSSVWGDITKWTDGAMAGASMAQRDMRSVLRARFDIGLGPWFRESLDEHLRSELSVLADAIESGNDEAAMVIASGIGLDVDKALKRAWNAARFDINSRYSFIEMQDMQWLRDTHLPELDLTRYGSAAIHGSDDMPMRIDLFVAIDPSATDIPDVWIANESGSGYVQLPPASPEFRRDFQDAYLATVMTFVEQVMPTRNPHRTPLSPRIRAGHGQPGDVVRDLPPAYRAIYDRVLNAMKAPVNGVTGRPIALTDEAERQIMTRISNIALKRAETGFHQIDEMAGTPANQQLFVWPVIEAMNGAEHPYVVLEDPEAYRQLMTMIASVAATRARTQEYGIPLDAWAAAAGRRAALRQLSSRGGEFTPNLDEFPEAKEVLVVAGDAVDSGDRERAVDLVRQVMELRDAESGALADWNNYDVVRYAIRESTTSSAVYQAKLADYLIAYWMEVLMWHNEGPPGDIDVRARTSTNPHVGHRGGSGFANTPMEWGWHSADAAATSAGIVDAYDRDAGAYQWQWGERDPDVILPAIDALLSGQLEVGLQLIGVPMPTPRTPNYSAYADVAQGPLTTPPTGWTWEDYDAAFTEGYIDFILERLERIAGMRTMNATPAAKKPCLAPHTQLKADPDLWAQCKFVGIQKEEDEGYPDIELRDCTCGSTLAKPVEAKENPERGSRYWVAGVMPTSGPGFPNFDRALDLARRQVRAGSGPWQPVDIIWGIEMAPMVHTGGVDFIGRPVVRKPPAVVRRRRRRRDRRAVHAEPFHVVATVLPSGELVVHSPDDVPAKFANGSPAPPAPRTRAQASELGWHRRRRRDAADDLRNAIGIALDVNAFDDASNGREFANAVIRELIGDRLVRRVGEGIVEFPAKATELARLLKRDHDAFNQKVIAAGEGIATHDRAAGSWLWGSRRINQAGAGVGADYGWGFIRTEYETASQERRAELSAAADAIEQGVDLAVVRRFGIDPDKAFAEWVEKKRHVQTPYSTASPARRIDPEFQRNFKSAYLATIVDFIRKEDSIDRPAEPQPELRPGVHRWMVSYTYNNDGAEVAGWQAWEADSAAEAVALHRAEHHDDVVTGVFLDDDAVTENPHQGSRGRGGEGFPNNVYAQGWAAAHDAAETAGLYRSPLGAAQLGTGTLGYKWDKWPPADAIAPAIDAILNERIELGLQLVGIPMPDPRAQDDKPYRWTWKNYEATFTEGYVDRIMDLLERAGGMRENPPQWQDLNGWTRAGTVDASIDLAAIWSSPAGISGLDAEQVAALGVAMDLLEEAGDAGKTGVDTARGPGKFNDGIEMLLDLELTGLGTHGGLFGSWEVADRDAVRRADQRGLKVGDLVARTGSRSAGAQLTRLDSVDGDAWLVGYWREVYRQITEQPRLAAQPKEDAVENLTDNPAWVTSLLAKHLESMEEHVPAKWLPKLTKVAAKRGKLTAAVKEWGCGSYGCAYPTLDKKVALKVTTDDTEFQFAEELFPALAAQVTCVYHLTAQLPEKHKGRAVYLLWRDAADRVGEIDKFVEERGGSAADAEDAVDVQHKAAQVVYDALQSGQPAEDLIDAWKAAAKSMGERVPELRELADGMITNLKKNKVFMGDLHAGNIGLIGDRWLCVDPGNIAVLSA